MSEGGRATERAPTTSVASYSILEPASVCGILTDGDGRGRVNEADLDRALRPRVVREYAGAPLDAAFAPPLGGVAWGAGVVRTRATPDRVVADHAAALAAAADAAQVEAQAGDALRPHEFVAGLSPPRFTGLAAAIPRQVERLVEAEMRQMGVAAATLDHLLRGQPAVDFVLDALLGEVDRGDRWNAAARGVTAAGEPARRIDEHRGLVEHRVYPDLGEPASLAHIHATLFPWRPGTKHALPCCNAERCLAVAPVSPGMPLDAKGEPPAPLCACLPPEVLRAWVDLGEAPDPGWPCWLCHVHWVEQRYLAFARIDLTPPYPLNLYQVVVDEHGVSGFPADVLLPTVAEQEARGTGVYGAFPRASLLAYAHVGAEGGRGRGGRGRSGASRSRIVWAPPDFVFARSSSRRGAPYRPVRSAPPLCTRFRWSSNYALAPQVDPPVRRWRLRPTPDSPLGEEVDAPWALLRAYFQRPAWSPYLDPLLVCTYDDTVRHVRAGRLGGLAAAVDDLSAYGWEGTPPPVRGHAHAWAMWLRLGWAEETASLFISDPRARLALQRYADTHLPMLGLTYVRRAWSDDALAGEAAWLTERPSDWHGAWSGALPAAVDLLDTADLFRQLRPQRHSPHTRLIHLLSKQMPHTCVIRGWTSAILANANASELECQLLVDLVLVYGVLGNFVNPWGDDACHTPWRPPALERALMLRAVRQAVAGGHKSAIRFVQATQSYLQIAARFYLVDVMQASPALAGELANVYSLDRSMREWMQTGNRMRRAFAACDWRGMARGRRADAAVDDAARQAATMFDAVHSRTLRYQFKLRKGSFVVLIGRILTDLAGRDPADLPPRAFFDLETPAAETGDRLDPSVLQACRRLAVYAAGRGDNYLPVGWLSTVLSAEAYTLIVDMYAGYEADSADNQLKVRLGALEARDRQSVLVMQRFFALLLHLKSGLLLPLEARAGRAQEAALYAKHCQLTGRPFDPRVAELGTVHYCRCGVILSPCADPPAAFGEPEKAAQDAEKTIHAIGLGGGGFDLATGSVRCTKRRPNGTCGLTMRSVNLVGRLLVLGGVAYTLCTAPACGIVTQVSPAMQGPHGPVCGHHAPSAGAAAAASPPDAVVRAAGGDALRAAAFAGRRPHGEAGAPVCEACGVRTTPGAAITVVDWDAPSRLRGAALCPRCAGILPHLGRKLWTLDALRHALKRPADGGDWVRASRVDWRRAAGLK